MYFDALAQFLIYSNWRKVLLVHGPSKIDHARAKTLHDSLKKFGADISDIREFTVSHHPDDRECYRFVYLAAAKDRRLDYSQLGNYGNRGSRSKAKHDFHSEQQERSRLGDTAGIREAVLPDGQCHRLEEKDPSHSFG